MILRSVIGNNKFFTISAFVWMLGGAASLAQTPPCTGDDTSPYPCTVAGTLLVVSRPSGDLFGGGGGGGGGGADGQSKPRTSIINDPQDPGYLVTIQPFLQGSGSAQISFSGTLNLATVSGQPTLVAVQASVTCGVTGAGSMSFTVSTPGGPMVLNCPKVAAAGTVTTATGQIVFSPVSSLALTLQLAGTAATPADSLTLGGYSLRAQILSPTHFVPVTPCRIADTRNPDGAFGGPAIAAGGSRDFAIPASACGIPAGAAAYSMNVAVVPRGTLGFLTIWPAGQSQPLAATLNSIDGRIKSNAAIVPAGSNGAVSVFATDTTDVILDINGYFVLGNNPTALAFYPVTPCRVADTRNSNGPLGGPSLAAQTTRSFPILTSACALPANAQAYALNFAAVPKGPLGFLTAWPTGRPQPLVASLNDLTGTVASNAVIVPAGTNGAVSVFATDPTDLVIDISGYFAPPGTGGLSMYSVSPCRVVDTRSPAGVPPFTTIRDVNVTAAPCGVPASAQAYVFNATVIPPGPLGFITLWPQGQQQPLAATLNALDGAITNNLAIVPARTGSISVFPSDPTYLVLDIFGYFAP